MHAYDVTAADTHMTSQLHILHVHAHDAIAENGVYVCIYRHCIMYMGMAVKVTDGVHVHAYNVTATSDTSPVSVYITITLCTIGSFDSHNDSIKFHTRLSGSVRAVDVKCRRHHTSSDSSYSDSQGLC